MTGPSGELAVPVRVSRRAPIPSRESQAASAGLLFYVRLPSGPALLVTARSGRRVRPGE